MDLGKRRNPGCLNLQLSILISYLVSIISNFFLIMIMYTLKAGFLWVGIGFSIALILLTLFSLKYYLTYTSNTVIRFRSSTRFYILCFLANVICYIVLFIILLFDGYGRIDDFKFFLGFGMLAWLVFHYLHFSLVNNFIKNLEGKSGVSLVERDFKELGSN
jgi:hypothetical protein